MTATPEGASGARDQPTGLPAELFRRISERERAHERYRLGEELARGGQGVVLSVWDQDLRRSLAMKVLHGAVGEREDDSSGPDERTIGRFLEEAQVTGQLDHPGIVPVHELGLDSDGRTYFTMKLVKGRDLRAIFELVQSGAEGWSLTRALGVMLKVCEAMAYAHAKGVIHRDLKPANVMVGRFGEVYVMDWGLARVLGESDQKDLRIQSETIEVRSARRELAEGSDSPLVTMDGDVVGTPAFMSPEQASGELAAMGPASDVYSIGAMLYQLLTQHFPYSPPGARMSNRAVWLEVQKGPPMPVAELAPDVPASSSPSARRRWRASPRPICGHQRARRRPARLPRGPRRRCLPDRRGRRVQEVGRAQPGARRELRDDLLDRAGGARRHDVGAVARQGARRARQHRPRVDQRRARGRPARGGVERGTGAGQ